MYISADKAKALKETRPKELKVRGPDLTILTAPPRFNNSKSSANTRREKKKDRRRQEQWQQP